ncbi:ParB/RepB/Spo0J family partition protein [Alkalihalophilus marmarensis]|uniref:ParB/RepB/Spo0J family partition protein n=1 Tax=Alkalihalophilus marmarensis TaxID=521377 RepID=UPI002E1B6DE4|nr:ParB/RepB/Spo0J family partition protein [Alkalihalophilus marmarensis]
MKLKLEEIITNENQPRKHFNEERLQELANSIKFDGLQEPILVRPFAGKYEIVQGERRYRAHKIAGISEIEVKVKDLSTEDAFHLSVIENIQREQMTPIEEANAFMKYVEMGFTHEQIAKKVSKNREYITSRLRLLKLVPFIHDWIAKGVISDGHCKQILKMESIYNRLCEGKRTTYKTLFEEFQYKFHDAFWQKEIRGEKITVNEVKGWVENWRYGLIKSTILYYIGSANVVVNYERGMALTAELECQIANLHIRIITEDDIVFANKFELESYKEHFNENLRPWMIDKYWDELKFELFSGNVDKDEKWNAFRDFETVVNEGKELGNTYNNDDLKSKSIEQITDEIKEYQQQLQLIADKTGKSVEELMKEFTN